MKIKLLERHNKQSYLGPQSSLRVETHFNKSSSQSFRQNQIEHDYEQLNSPLQVSEKSNSELWSNKKIKIAQKQNEQLTHRKDDIKRSSKFNQFSYEHDHIGIRSSLFYQIIPAKECTLLPIQLLFPRLRRVGSNILRVV